MNRIKIQLLMLAATLCVSCSRYEIPDEPMGMADLSEALKLASEIHEMGDSRLLLAHSDLRSVPEKALNDLLETLEKWEGLPPGFENEKVSVQLPSEYDPHEMAPEQFTEEDLKDFIPITWNVQPDRFIVFYNISKKNRNIRTRNTFGVFEKDGKWYFSTGYKKI
ncbi:hypothetical protein [Pelagicoccus sp. SDUM812003]|uniref:hypothetical protein n=1 Tax=Pelagicoccus sp. SDUM812003 TaxID=3041267 RepID=UPI00280DAF4B|nr:hypothetical protein [Pelagicoccus sp. SDUM812003]MDQ8205746.1 hypothetical protein [Pelagicoccus sp. SDUM812003]